MKITIKKAGLLSTIQDMGRIHYLAQAVPVSGAMDNLSARIANRVLGNDDNDAVIELTYGGVEFTIDTHVLIALSGEGGRLNINGHSIPSDRPVFVPAGAKVVLDNCNSGSRAYLAVAGGWDVPQVLGSRSTYLIAGFGGLDGRCLHAGDKLNNIENLSPMARAVYDSLKGDVVSYPKWSMPQGVFLSAQRKIIRVMPGHEFTWFDAGSILGFLSQPYTLTPDCNRMGYHLSGPVIKRFVKTELLSTAVVPGTIQVTGEGLPVLLMADCQTTGGYPRIAKVADVDMPLCAQLKPGDTVYFKETSWKEAEMLYIEREKDMHKLTTAIEQKYGF